MDELSSASASYVDPLTGLPADDELLDATEASDKSYSRIDIDFGAFGKILSEVGPYEIIEPLGRGGMGMVFRAKHKTLGREVALKLMRPDYASDEKFSARFLREARLAAAVEHQNVVTVYDAGKVNNLLYMALKYVDGGDLRQLLKLKERLPVMSTLNLMLDCARGLQAIHEAGLLHRDIKPANVLISKTGAAMIADLGLARTIEKKGNEGLTTMGVPLGTPAYMSPEQAQGVDDLDIRTDIYSLGTTMFTALAGTCPFKGGSTYELVAKILMHEPPDVREYFKDIPDNVVMVLRKAMARKRDDRYSTPAKMVEALETVRMQLRGVPGNPEDSEISLPSMPFHTGGVRPAVPDPKAELSRTGATERVDGRPGSGSSSVSIGGFKAWLKNLLMPGQAPPKPDHAKDESQGSWTASGSQSESQDSGGSSTSKGRRRRRRRQYRGQTMED